MDPVAVGTSPRRFHRKMRGICPAFFLGCLLNINVAVANDLAISADRQSELVRLVRNDCGSCHGLKLTGGLGPSLLPGSLRDKPLDSLRETILHGRTGTAMPPWDKFLSVSDAEWIVQQLEKGFPDVR